MEERLDKLEKKIDMLTDIINNQVVQECEKMGNHIAFVENVYTIVKTPLEYIFSYFNKTSLPDIQIQDIQMKAIPDIQIQDIQMKAIPDIQIQDIQMKAILNN